MDQPMLPGNEPSDRFCGRPLIGKIVKWGSIVFLIYLFIVSAVQGVLYGWACFKCGPNHLKDYAYPGGGHFDMVPSETVLTISQGRWGWIAEVWPAENGMKTGAATVGTIYRTWGPLFFTYTFEDNNGLYTWVVRDRPISIGGSHKLMRCDGEGESYFYSEGGHWLMNRFKYLIGTQITSEYNIWNGSTKVGTVSRVGGLHNAANSQLMFKVIDDVNRFGSGSMIKINHHLQPEWLVQTNSTMSGVPNWVPTSITSLFAIHLGEKWGQTRHLPHHPPDTSLLAMGAENVSMVVGNSTASHAAALSGVEPPTLQPVNATLLP